jgi:hypothetical protein
MAEEFELRHYIVQDDVTREDLGVATIKHATKPATHIKHWITFPDGTVRKQYNARRILDTEADLLIAFESLPQLKVSYRPIAEHFAGYEGLYCFFMVIFFGLSMLAGLVLMVALVAGSIDTIINNFASYYAASFLLYGTVASTLVYLFSNQFACPRREQLTADDLEMNLIVGRISKKAREERKAKANEAILRDVLVDTRVKHPPTNEKGIPHQSVNPFRFVL